MTIDMNAVWFALLIAAILGSVKLLLNRMADMEATLARHGRKLVRIETKLGIYDDVEQP